MSQLFSIQDDKVVISKLALGQTEGSVLHDGSLTVSEDANFKNNTVIEKDLTVRGSLTVDVIHANQIINNNLTNGAKDGSTKFLGNDEAELNGQGLAWATLNSEKQLVYRTGSRLWTNLNLDLSAGSSYKIDDIEVLTSNTLGSGITRSSLRRLAPLDSLVVQGTTNLGDCLIVDSDILRVGINTDTPNAALSIVDDNVEIVLGSSNGAGIIGVFNNNDLALVTDNMARVTIKKGGDVHVGSATNQKINLYVHGTLYADNIASDSTTETNSSVEFKGADSNIYGLGLQWLGQGSAKQFVMRSGPDRLWSTEHLELDKGKALWIDGNAVLSTNALGDSVTDSKLTSLGVLSNLKVSGNSELGTVQAGSTSVADLSADLVKTSNINSASKVSMVLDTGEYLYADSSVVRIGNSESTARTVKIFGNIAVNSNTVDPSVDLSVAGNIAFAGRKFFAGTSAPTAGSYNAGDTCWNETPNVGSYMGWVCVASGTPGQWAPFGLIG